MSTKQTTNPTAEPVVVQPMTPIAEVEPSAVAVEAVTAPAPAPTKTKSGARSRRAPAGRKKVPAEGSALPPIVADAVVAEVPVAKPKKLARADKPQKVEKAVKQKKARLVRDSYAMPENEYQRIAELKKRLVGLSADYKKSELLRAGIALLAALNDSELTAVMGGIERIKTGRPRKK